MNLIFITLDATFGARKFPGEDATLDLFALIAMQKENELTQIKAWSMMNRCKEYTERGCHVYIVKHT